MKNIDKDKLFADVEKMIYKLAWKASNRDGLPFDEALSEVYWDFVRAYNWRFDPKRGVKFSTFLYFLTGRHFQTLRRHRMQQAERFPVCEINEELVGAAPEQRSPCLEAVEGMSTEAQEIVALLLETPRELVDVWNPCSPKDLLRRVKSYLREQGRTRKQLELAEAEIQQTFRAIWATP